MFRTVLGTILCLSLPTSAWADDKESDFAKAIVGKWKFARGGPEFGILVHESEFTKDGKFLQMRTTGKWSEIGTYRFDKDELVLSLSASGGKKATEMRCKIASITDTKLLYKIPDGEFKRVK